MQNPAKKIVRKNSGQAKLDFVSFAFLSSKPKNQMR